MASYPVKLLKDKDGTAFIPVVNSDSIITPEGDTLNDLLEEKQDLLTSGTNIKTINNESLLGSGNISIQGGGDATDVQVNGVSITQNNVANIATQTAYNSLTNKIATKNDIPTQTSQLTNNSGYITSSVDNLTNYTKTNDLSEVATSGSYEDLSDKPTIPSKMSDLTNDNNFVSDASYVHTDNNYTSTEKNKLSGIASGAEVNVQSNWTETNTSSDAYIKNKPTIPTVNNGKLTIQKNGTDVQTFTANQSSNVTANITVPTQVSELTNDSGYTTNTGTITKVQANGTDVASSGTANIPAATTSKYGVTKLSSATDSTSEALAATPKAVKAAYDLAASKGTGTITGVSVNGTSVATSGVANITSVPASVLSGAIPSAVTATTQTSSDNSTKIATTAFVKTAIDNLPEPMVFKGSLGTGGTITSLPTNGTATVGDTYKVITDGTYASKAAKIGDTFICLTKTSSANTWELIPSGDDTGGTVTSVKINATSPIVIDNNTAITTSGERTISHATSGVTAGTYKSVTVDSKGHVTAGTNPTTLSGYGITDAKISNGTITLGSNTITPSTVQNIKDGSATGSVRTSSSSSENTNYTMGQYAFSEGYYTKASGKSSHAEGWSANASGESSHAEGFSTAASGSDSHAEGYYTVASKAYAHSEGDQTTASGQASHTEGTYCEATAESSHAEGYKTHATGLRSHAEGLESVAEGYYSHAEGFYTVAAGASSHAEGGYDGYFQQGTVVAIDTENKTYEVSGLPIIYSASNYPAYNGAFYSKNSTTPSLYKIISTTKSSDNFIFTVSEMHSNIAVGDPFYIYIGSKTIGRLSHAEGDRCYTIGTASHAEGCQTRASGSYSHAGGSYTIASQSSQTAIGKYNDNKSNTLFEVGNGTADDARSNAFVVYSSGKAEIGADPTTNMGVATKQYVDNNIPTNIKNGSATGSVRTSYSASEYSDYTMGQYAFSEGYSTQASGKSSHAEGSYTTASGATGAHSEGSSTIASGNYSHAEGSQTRATNSSSHAEGYQTIASGDRSHAEGWSTIASGNYSHAEGGRKDGFLFSGTVVAIDTENQTYEVSGVPKVDDTLSDSAIYSGAIYSKTNYIDPECRVISAVRSSDTDNVTFTVSSFDPSYIAVGNSFRLFEGSKASGNYSHAEGYGTYAIGFASHAEGYSTIASESYSHAGGYYTKAKSSYQTAVGKYNDNKNNTLFEVGNGTADDSRSNAFEVYSDGRAIVGADPTAAMGVATKQYVDNAISATDTGWVNLTPLVGSWTILRCRRIGNMVTVEGHISSYAFSGSATNVSTLSEQYRPVGKTEYFYGFEGGRRMSRWYITAAGTLGIDWVANISDGSIYTGDTWHNFTITYMVD